MLDSIPITLDDRMASRMRAGDYRAWRAKVEAVGGCLQPVRLAGSWSVTDAAGAVLAATSGNLFAPCGNRRASVCPTCSDRYAADAFHLLRAGLSGGTKGIPTTVTTRPRVFATLTAPSFGPVHGHRTTRAGRRVPCRCGTYHHPDDPALGTPVNPGTYDYTGAVLWQANTGALWHRFATRLRRTLARLAGLTGQQFAETARLSYAKVAEYQRRGLVHFHAVIRLDGPDGPTSPPPRWATAALLDTAIRNAASAVALTTHRPDGTDLDLRWGAQVDVRHITTTDAAELGDGGEISESRLANYVAKYATKGTGTTDGTDRPIRSQAHIDQLTGITAHHRRMIQTAWDLGEQAEYAPLRLRKWAHMLSFRGHFLSKSVCYSVTFGAIRDERRTWRHTDTLTRLGADPDTVTVVNHWNFVGVGYRDHAERELAAGIAERQATHRKQRLHTEHTTIRKAA